MNAGLEYGSLGVHRSALSRYHTGLDGFKVGEHPRMTQFMKGAFIKKPPRKFLLPTWDLPTVLEVLRQPPFEPLDSISLKMLTLKLVFLLAITSTRRCSEIQALGRDSAFLRFEKYGVRMRTLARFLPKTANPTHLGQDIFLPAYCKYVKELCVVRCIKTYLKVTEQFVDDSVENLLVAFGPKSKGKPVTTRTISGWLVRVIRLAYDIKNLNPPQVKAHSTRGQGSSWALFQKAPVAELMKAADWRASSTFVKHYNLKIWKKEQAAVGRAILKVAKKSSKQ